MNKPTDPVLNLIKLLDRPIAFHRVLAEVAGSALGGLMLSQAIYWQGRASKEGGGWWYKTREEWYAETMMNRTEQEAVRRKLKSIDLMDEERRGLPARLYYRINLETLAERLSSIPPPPDLTPQGDNSGPENPAGQNQKRKSKKPPLPDDPIERTLAIYKSKLNELSRTGYLRGQKAGAVTEYVDYAEVLRQTKGICHICEQLITEGVGQREQCLTFDHVIALAEGGQHTAENIKPAHARCNILKGRTAANKLAEDRPTGGQRVDQQEGPTAANIYTETTTETTTESNKETPPNPPKGEQAGEKPSKPKKATPPDYSPEFEAAWKDYPARAGDNPKPAAWKAWSARLKEGHSPEEMHEGVRRYAAFIRITDKEGTQFVKHALRFFDPSKPFLADWTPPPPKLAPKPAEPKPGCMKPFPKPSWGGGQ